LHELRGKAWAFPRCLASHVSGPEDEVALARELRLRLGEKDAARLLTAPNRPLQALADLSYCMVSFARFFLFGTNGSFRSPRVPFARVLARPVSDDARRPLPLPAMNDTTEQSPDRRETPRGDG